MNPYTWHTQESKRPKTLSEENTIGMESVSSWQTIVKDVQPVKPQNFEHT